VLVHGLWMHGIAMELVRRRIERGGFHVTTYSYPTVRLNLRDNAARLASYCGSLTCDTLHLVGHSMGGVVALAAAQLVPPERRGRVVVIGTPFADSYSGRRMQQFAAGRVLLGKCMSAWLAQSREGVSRDVELGVIAGNGGIGLGCVIAPGLPRPHDGVIAVEETRVPGMHDHIILPVSHTAMLMSRPVARQVCAFLKNGRFARTAKPTR